MKVRVDRIIAIDRDDLGRVAGTALCVISSLDYAVTAWGDLFFVFDGGSTAARGRDVIDFQCSFALVRDMELVNDISAFIHIMEIEIGLSTKNTGRVLVGHRRGDSRSRWQNGRHRIGAVGQNQDR